MGNVCSAPDIGKLLECVPDCDCIVTLRDRHFLERAGGDMQSLAIAEFCGRSIDVDAGKGHSRVASGGEKASHVAANLESAVDTARKAADAPDLGAIREPLVLEQRFVNAFAQRSLGVGTSDRLRTLAGTAIYVGATCAAHQSQ